MIAVSLPGVLGLPALALLGVAAALLWSTGESREPAPVERETPPAATASKARTVAAPAAGPARPEPAPDPGPRGSLWLDRADDDPASRTSLWSRS